MKIEKMLEKFLRSKAASNRSSTTIEYYDTVFRVFSRWLYKQDITDSEDITQAVLEDYMISLRSEYANATIQGRYIALATLFNWAHSECIYALNPMDNIEMPKGQKKIIPSFSRTEINKILGSFNKGDFIGLRNYTIVLTLFGTGIRKSELLGMTLKSIDFDTLRVVGKGNKERIIPVSRTLREALKTYLRARKSFLDNFTDYGNFWLNKDRNPLQSSGVSQIFKTLKSNIPECSTRLSPHTFRHTFALMYIRNGGDVFSLKDILGHEDISTTKIYVDMVDDDIRRQFSKYNPLDNTHWKY